jgi:hypothetical protein
VFLLPADREQRVSSESPPGFATGESTTTANHLQKGAGFVELRTLDFRKGFFVQLAFSGARQVASLRQWAFRIGALARLPRAQPRLFPLCITRGRIFTSHYECFSKAELLRPK